MSDQIHIVCLDAPSPPDYGGAIDMYCKIKALSKSGKKIILHFFDYRENRGISGLEDHVQEVYTYPRKKIPSWRSLPYFVSSRISRELINRLNQDQFPVLLEGLHCTGILPFLQNRKRVVVRMHNEEKAYYRKLGLTELSPVRKLYYYLESNRTAAYYRSLKDHDPAMACLSTSDMEVLKQAGFRDLHFIPCFIPWQELKNKTGKGDYCLYHGNLAIAENEAAALWLMQVFDNTGIVLVIAGRSISERLKARAAKIRNLRLINNPSMDELDALIRDAHINVLPSMNATGVKLKLLHALVEGRFCLTNSPGVKGSAVENLVTMEDEVDGFRRKIHELYAMDFTEEDKKNRREVLAVYDNMKNAASLIELW